MIRTFALILMTIPMAVSAAPWESMMKKYFSDHQDQLQSNAMAYYSSAIVNYDAQRYRPAMEEMIVTGERGWESRSPKVERVLAENGGVMRDIWKGNDVEECRAPHWSEMIGNPSLYPHTPKEDLEGITELFLVTAQKAIHEKDFERAMTSYETALTFLNRITAGNTTFDSRAVTVTLQFRTARLYHSMLDIHDPTPEQFQRIRDFASYYRVSSVAKAIELNREIAEFGLRKFLQNPKQQQEFFSSSPPELVQQVRNAGLRSDRILNDIDRMFDFYESSLSGTMANYQREVEGFNADNLHPLVVPMAGAIDTFYGAKNEELYTQVLIDFLAIRSALQLYNIETGGWPDNLKDVIDSDRLLTDPYTGNPYIYDRSVYPVVYSLGSDLYDNEKKVNYKPSDPFDVNGNIALTLKL